jgi:hypothetical protein
MSRVEFKVKGGQSLISARVSVELVSGFASAAHPELLYRLQAAVTRAVTQELNLAERVFTVPLDQVDPADLKEFSSPFNFADQDFAALTGPAAADVPEEPPASSSRSSLQ